MVVPLNYTFSTDCHIVKKTFYRAPLAFKYFLWSWADNYIALLYKKYYSDYF